MRFRAVMQEDGRALVIKNPAAELLTTLKEGKLAAIRSDHKELPPEFWDDRSTDLRTWPKVRFRRDDILRLWPGIETLAKDEGSRESAHPPEVKASPAPLPTSSTAPLGLSDRFPGRPSLKEPIRARLKQRIAARSECGAVAAEARVPVRMGS